MKTVIQRVERASVTVDGEMTGQIGRGLVILLGVVKDDTEEDAAILVKKCAELRIFEDDDGKMNRSVGDVGGGLLVISQFTLAANCRKGRRPSFDDAAAPAEAERLYNLFCEGCSAEGLEVQTGRFAAMMKVELVNDGPVTIILDSAELMRNRKTTRN